MNAVNGIIISCNRNMEQIKMHKQKVQINISNDKKANVSQFRGFISIDQEMGREISMMFFNPTKRVSLSESGCLAGKL